MTKSGLCQRSIERSRYRLKRLPSRQPLMPRELSSSSWYEVLLERFVFSLGRIDVESRCGSNAEGYCHRVSRLCGALTFSSCFSTRLASALFLFDRKPFVVGWSAHLVCRIPTRSIELGSRSGYRPQADQTKYAAFCAIFQVPLRRL